jgi:transcriptional regulator with XRE-family HTH domain
MENTNLQERLTLLRKQKGITQKELAEKINYSDKVISKWERGESLPSILVLKELSKFYNIPVNEILNDDTEDKEPLPNNPKLDVNRTRKPSFVSKYFIIVPFGILIASIWQGPEVFAVVLFFFSICLLITAGLTSKAEWVSTYKGHSIKIRNKITRLELFIDDQMVDGKYGIIALNPTLSGRIENELIKVRISNGVGLKCYIFVE